MSSVFRCENSLRGHQLPSDSNVEIFLVTAWIMEPNKNKITHVPRTSISCHIYSAVIFIWQLVPVRHGHFEVAIWIWTIWKCFNKNLSDLSSFLTVRRFGCKLKKKKESKIWMIIQVIKCRQEMVAKKKKKTKTPLYFRWSV